VKKPTKNAVDWECIWADFSKWVDRYRVYDWEKQKTKIAFLVDARLKASKGAGR
jgi:hypothetical protein